MTEQGVDLAAQRRRKGSSIQWRAGTHASRVVSSFTAWCALWPTALLAAQMSYIEAGGTLRIELRGLSSEVRGPAALLRPAPLARSAVRVTGAPLCRRCAAGQSCCPPPAHTPSSPPPHVLCRHHAAALHRRPLLQLPGLPSAQSGL
jgi:hypothetical protein